MSLSFDDSTSDMSPSSEHPKTSHPMEVDGSLQELGWQDFSTTLGEGFLPHDDTQRTPFDHTMHYEIGDPHATGGGLPRVYDKSAEFGGPDWQLLFEYLLQQCRHIQHYEAIYLLVDTRDLTVVDNVEPSLAHWPAVAAWWSSRLRYVGPRDEQVDLVFVRAGRNSGLHLVHPTWAGTFVLAALVFLFPKTHFALLDSDSVPVTLFEIEELWVLTSEPLSSQVRAPNHGTDGPAHKARKTQQDHDEEEKAPRVILVTEPHTDINAGFVVIFGSQHSAPIDIENLDQHCAQNKDTDLTGWWEETATIAHTKYRALTLEYLCNYSGPMFLTSEEQGQVLQSGLALSPIAWARTRYTVDWITAWALVGEWASRELFPPPTRGEWPKHGHDEKLLDHFKDRRPGLVGWARAAFEQGALPALAMLPGEVETRVLPGDSIFQATHIIPGYMRPAVVHGYGGAKVDLPTTLSNGVDHAWCFPCGHTAPMV